MQEDGHCTTYFNYLPSQTSAATLSNCRAHDTFQARTSGRTSLRKQNDTNFWESSVATIICHTPFKHDLSACQRGQSHKAWTKTLRTQAPQKMQDRCQAAPFLPFTYSMKISPQRNLHQLHK